MRCSDCAGSGRLLGGVGVVCPGCKGCGETVSQAQVVAPEPVKVEVAPEA